MPQISDEMSQCYRCGEAIKLEGGKSTNGTFRTRMGDGYPVNQVFFICTDCRLAVKS